MNGVSARPAFPLAHPAILLGAAALVLHAIVNRHYDFFRDELYFIVCGRRPAWGYVDQPPLVPLIAAFADWIRPGSVLVLRALPALVGAATIAGAVALARLLGGRIFAQWLAGLCILSAPNFRAQGLLLTTDLFQPLAWIGCSAVLIGIARTGDHRRWLLLGLIVGLALWSKYLILFDLAALALALPFSPLRRGLVTPWPYLAALVALGMILPNLLWQGRHGWPFLEIGAAGAAGKNVAMSLPAYLAGQVVLYNPAAAIVWVAGLAGLVFSARLRRYRVFALQYVALIMIEVALHGKDYYTASLYPTLFAFGAVAVESAVVRPVLRGALAFLVLAVGMIVAPFAIPVLPVDRFIAYEHWLGFKPAASEHRALAELPQEFADMFGWRDMAAAVSRAYWALPEDERARAVFIGNNYGEAAAVDVFGDRLPPAISGHNNYFLWGPRGHDGAILIGLTPDLAATASRYASVEIVGKTANPYAMPDEANLFVVVVRNRKASLIDDWTRLKNYN